MIFTLFSQLAKFIWNQCIIFKKTIWMFVSVIQSESQRCDFWRAAQNKEVYSDVLKWARPSWHVPSLAALLCKACRPLTALLYNFSDSHLSALFCPNGQCVYVCIFITFSQYTHTSCRELGGKERSFFLHLNRYLSKKCITLIPILSKSFHILRANYYRLWIWRFACFVKDSHTLKEYLSHAVFPDKI